jgi:hypothetical protein
MGTTTHSSPEDTVALQGTLDTFALPDVLRLLATTRKTGQLRITGERGTGSVWAADGKVVGIEAPDAPTGGEPVDALFQLLRFEEGAFTFDAEASPEEPDKPVDVDAVLVKAEALLDEWRSIESVVPSLDAWVTLRKRLPQPDVVISQDQWTTLVAVGGGATVRRIADELSLGELPISRAVKELVELSLVEVADAAPANAIHARPAPTTTAAPAGRPLLAGAEPEAPRTPSGTRSRRSRAAAPVPAEPEVFVPLDLPGQGSSPSYDEPEAEAAVLEPMEVDDLAAAFPGLANRVAASVDVEDEEEVAKQLATLSPRAANAIRAAAEATTDEEREAALGAVEDDSDQPLNRGLLLKFLSSVKS